MIIYDYLLFPTDFGNFFFEFEMLINMLTYNINISPVIHLYKDIIILYI